MSWIATVPYMVVVGSLATLAQANASLGVNDFIGVLDNNVSSTVFTTITGYGVQGGGPTPCAVFHNWLSGDTAQNYQDKVPGSVPFMGCFNAESSSATLTTELSAMSSICSTAKTNLVAKNQDSSRRFMWAPSLDQLDFNVENCAQYADWVLLQGQQPLHNAGTPSVPKFLQQIEGRMTDVKNAKRTAKRMVQLSVTLTESDATILSAFQAMTNIPEAISIYAGGTSDLSARVLSLITLLRAS